MLYLIIIELVINLILLLVYNMHMFQLNSYFFSKHSRWMKTNWKSLAIQEAFIIIAGACFNWPVAVAIILAISILYNIPKKKSKIPLKFTQRVIRLFVTEAILCTLTCALCGLSPENPLTIGFIIGIVLNILSPIIGIVANIINKPIENAIKQWYINDAKKILRSMPNLTIIGVTGSYGKTSVKNFLAKTLSEKYEVLVTPKNYNTTMGVVKTIRENLTPLHQIFVCEMGATKLGDIKEICELVHPTMGVITAVGPQHMDSFKTIENVAKTKFELADEVLANNGTLFLNYNNEEIVKYSKNMNKISYGIDNKEADYNAYDIQSSSEGLTFKMKDFKTQEEINFKTKIIGKHNVLNLAGAIAVANYMGIPMKKIVPEVRELRNVKHRLELLGTGNLTIIDDAYNSNPISSKSAVETLGEFEGTKIIVTPGMIELKKDQYKYNYEFGTYMADVCDYIYLVGEINEEAMREGAKSKGYNENKIINVSSPQEAMQKIAGLGISGKINVLLENDLPDNYK